MLLLIILTLCMIVAGYICGNEVKQKSWFFAGYWFLVFCWFWLLILFLSTVALGQDIKHYPQGAAIKHLWYEPRNCKHDPEDEMVTRCTRVVVEFYGITPDGKPAVVNAPETEQEQEQEQEVSTLVKPQHPEHGGYIYYYHPAQCKVMPYTPYHLCRNVWWRELPVLPLNNVKVKAK